MAAGCPAKCAKFLLIAFNIIFWLSGAAILAIGIWIIVDDSILKYVNLVGGDSDGDIFKYAAYALIGVGSFVFVTGFAGCCGAIKESPCLLGIYIFLLVIVMLGEIAAGVLAFLFRNKIEKLITVKIMDTIKKENYTTGTDDSGNIIYSQFGISLNLFQTEFKCCGINGSDDYKNLQDKQVFTGTNQIPYACYALKKGTKNPQPQLSDIDKNVLRTAGCKDEMMNWFEKHAIILIGIAIGIACLEIFGIIFAVCLCRNPSVEYE